MSLSTEYSKYGIDFQANVPGFVTTKLAKIRKSSITTPTPNTYASVSVARMGTATTGSPYYVHQFIIFVMEQLPTWVAAKVVMDMHLGIRKKAMKKKAEKKD